MGDLEPRFDQIARLREKESSRLRADLDRWETIHKAEQRLREVDERFSRELLEDAGINVQRIEEHEREHRQQREALVEKFRAQLIDGPQTLEDFYRRRAVAFEFGSTPGVHLLPPVVATVGASNDLLLDSVEGTEEDDGTITPSGPDTLNISAKHSGSGIFGFLGDVVPYIEVDVYYSFVPQETGTHQFNLPIDLHGFYSVSANDSFWNSKSASVRLEIEIGVLQYASWKAKESWKVVRERKTNGTKNGRIDEIRNFATKAELDKESPVPVRVRLALTASGSGSGSFAEINFSAGPANYIGMLPATVQHL